MHLVFCTTGAHPQALCLNLAWKYNQGQDTVVWHEHCLHLPLDPLNMPWKPVFNLLGCMDDKKAKRPVSLTFP